jgi:gliding motility-associated-like protein
LDAGAGFSSYLWSTLDTTQTISARNEGEYSVTVTNAGGCSAADTFNLFVYPFATLTLGETVLCPNDTIEYTAPAGYTTYSWSTGSQTATTTISATGQYVLTVTDNNGCSVFDTLTVTDGGFTADAMVDPTQIDLGESAGLAVDVLGGSGSYSYNWTPANSLNDATLANPTATPDSTLTYLVIVTDDSTGCTASDTISITVFDGARYGFSDAFSPNGDNFNDTYYPLTYGNVEVTTFRIYNRWGELVHEALAPWDGRLDGVDQPMGTYVYYAVIEITSATGVVTETVQGSFTILR